MSAADAVIIETCAKEAEAGGCDCPVAPCEHDEAGRVIAARIRALTERIRALRSRGSSDE